MERTTIQDLGLISRNTYHEKVDSNLVEAFIHAIKSNPNKDLVFEVVRGELNNTINVYENIGTDPVVIVFVGIGMALVIILLLYLIWIAA